MAEFVLKNNFFEFDSKVFQQIVGTAIGTKFAPPYACIFMDQLETKFLETQTFKPLVWFRYIDDIFFIWTHGEEKLKTFMAELNSFNDNIKFTYEYNKDSIPFLGLKVISFNGKLITSFYSKPTDCRQYLHYESCHPDHTKRSIVYSQALRLKRVCSRKSDFKEHSLNLRSWFLRRGYPEKVINAEMCKVRFNSESSRFNNKQEKGVPLVVTFHPHLKVLQRIVDKHLHVLYMNDEVKRVFTPKPMVSFRSSRKISSYLVRAKLYPLERTVGSFKCGNKRCEVCQYIIEADTFTSSVTGETFKINHRFDCNSKCLVYLLTCNECKKQYTGQTTDNFRKRWNNYKSKSRSFDRGEKPTQEKLYRHFLNEGHAGFLHNISVTLIDKTDGSNPTERENYWMRTLKTLEPYGLNVENSISLGAEMSSVVLLGISRIWIW